MEDPQDELNQLNRKIASGTATPAEIERLVRWLVALDIQRRTLSAEELTEEQALSKTALRNRLIAEEPSSTQEIKELKWWASAWTKAAAILLVVGSISMALLHSGSDPTSNIHAKNISPGSQKASLTLADGSVVSLSEVAVGTTVALQGGIRVEKNKEGDIVYHANAEHQPVSGAQNTVSTPKGGHFKVTLPDGSIAWLNAASSIRYPLQFAANERRISMTGEVYFEIAKKELTDQLGRKRKLPFYVETNRQEIQVLGTHFNVNAYTDEPYTATTLTEGSVKVTALESGETALLKPGQQAQLAKGIAINNVDTEQFIAWINGDFVFRGEELQGVLRKVARWYDVEFDCPQDLAKLRFNGMVSRSQPLSTIIETLQSTKKIKVTLKERRIIVTD